MPRRSLKESGDASLLAGGSIGQSIVEAYLSELKAVSSTRAGGPETSYYPALANLFNEAGKSLKPRIRCVMNLKQQGAGMPDGGLFTADQLQRDAEGLPTMSLLPARGAIEAKSAGATLKDIASSDQVKRYLAKYGIVIVTNLRGFMVLDRGPNDTSVERESFSLAADELEFWRRLVAHPRATAAEQGERFVEFLKRACLHAAPLTNPKDVAWFLASYAREALARVEARKELPALQAVRAALEESLGMTFVADKGEHFFRSTLVQTLFYGVFSAWVLWHRSGPGARDRFDWKKAGWSLHVPFIRTLYEEVAKPSRLGPLGLVEVLDWAAGVLNRVDRAEFFQSYHDEQAVQYFYEPFLEAYDPDLRRDLGVWYTPPEIVKYQVARVDAVLREELDLPDGLADPDVIVLDPCCGTGAYLVETLRSIAVTLRDKGGDALVASDLKQAAMSRVCGFEIMPAPFVVSHLQLGLMLQTEGAPLDYERGERVGVYLTNALTGWKPLKEPKQYLWRELEEERDAASSVKLEKKILVVIGNPPYNAFAGVSPEEEQGLVEPYKKGLNKPPADGGWGIKKFNLDDLYVRFFRLAERRIAEMTGKGVVSFISNFSYLSDPSFVVMRERFLGEFDDLWLDCMNGDSRETGKLTPEGKPDPSVFSTEYNREGIRVGTAVCVIVRKPVRRKKPVVRFRHFWGAKKRAELLESLNSKRFDKAYRKADPRRENRLAFRPEDVAAHYTGWPLLTDLCAVAPFNGPIERRGNSLIRFPAQAKEFERLKEYLDPKVPDDEIQAIEPRFMLSSGEFRAKEARRGLKGKIKYQAAHIARYPFKPFDVRNAYLDADLQPLFSRPSPQLLSQRFPENAFFISRDTADKTPEGPPFFYSRLVCDYDAISGHARHFPILLLNGCRLEKQAEETLFSALGQSAEADVPVANLSAAARRYLNKFGVPKPDVDRTSADLIWMQALAIGFSPAYLTENADGIRRDWPRIPLPADQKLLKASAALGRQVAVLLDPEVQVPGVTGGKIGPGFKTIGLITKTGGRGAIDPAGRDLAVTAGWGHAGKGGVTMPARGRLVERLYNENERKAIETEAAAQGISAKDAFRQLGAKTCDVYLNDSVYWRNVPANVWGFYIGGYQVIKKWLSYREEELLGRRLEPDEAREVTSTARRIAAIVLLQRKLDANYEKVKATAVDWDSVNG